MIVDEIKKPPRSDRSGGKDNKMLSKVEKLILQECNDVESSDIYLIELYNNIKNQPDFKEYYAAIHSLNQKGYFDEYDEGINDTFVTLSTKGINYKKDMCREKVIYVIEFIILPLIIGVISTLITNFLSR